MFYLVQTVLLFAQLPSLILVPLWNAWSLITHIKLWSWCPQSATDLEAYFSSLVLSFPFCKMEELEGMICKVCVSPFSFVLCSVLLSFSYLFTVCLFMLCPCPSFLLAFLHDYLERSLPHAGSPWCAEASSYQLGRSHCAHFFPTL